jgi:predicted aconitase
MFLTREEETALAGENGPGVQKAMQLLVALGKIYAAERLVPITSAHLSGVSYKTIGDAGLRFLEEMAIDAKVSVKTTLNPAGMDRERWQEMGVPEEFARKQTAIIAAYARLGVETGCTCTPYLTGNAPRRGEHIAWAESSALSFANSVLGARTNREGGPGALAAAIIGKTPLYGLHLEQNRHPTVVISVDKGVAEESSDLSLIGHAVGARIGSEVPIFTGIRPGIDQLKSLAAAMAASGSIAMFHVEGVTPGSDDLDMKGLETIEIGPKETDEAMDSLTNAKEAQLVAIGCPHLSEEEMRRLALVLDGKRRRQDGPDVWFCTSRAMWLRCPKERAVLERFGKVLCDACMIVAPIEQRYQSTATNSAKACSYLPGLCSQKVMCRPLPALVEMIT